MSIVENKKNVKKFLLLEKRRNRLAIESKYTRFKRLYDKKYIFIKNENSSAFWNEKNFIFVNKNPMQKDKIRIVVNFLIKRDGKLLDIGFGNGQVEKELCRKSNNINIYGIDISSKSVEYMKRTIKGNFKKGSVLKIPFPDNFFDSILMLDVLEHIPTNKTFSAYEEIYRALKKGGNLIISVPINEGLDMYLKKGLNPNRHQRIYTDNVLTAECKIGGFEIINKKYLYAFNNFYLIKKMLINFLKLKVVNPNLMIYFAKK